MTDPAAPLFFFFFFRGQSDRQKRTPRSYATQARSVMCNMRRRRRRRRDIQEEGGRRGSEVTVRGEREAEGLMKKAETRTDEKEISFQTGKGETGQERERDERDAEDRKDKRKKKKLVRQTIDTSNDVGSLVKRDTDVQAHNLAGKGVKMHPASQGLLQDLHPHDGLLQIAIVIIVICCVCSLRFCWEHNHVHNHRSPRQSP